MFFRNYIIKNLFTKKKIDSKDYDQDNMRRVEQRKIKVNVTCNMNVLIVHHFQWSCNFCNYKLFNCIVENILWNEYLFSTEFAP